VEVPDPVSPFGYSMDFSDDTIVSNQPDNSGDPLQLDTTTTSQTTAKVTDQPDSDLTDKMLERYGLMYLSIYARRNT
jgi:hypothetical protein